MNIDKKQKILLVHNYYQIPGGEDIVVSNEKEMLEDNGHKVVFYSRHNNELKNFSLLRKLMLPFSTVFNIRTYFDIKKIIKQEKIDVVHVHNTLNLISPAVYYAALKCKVPVVQTVHNFRILCPAATFYRDGHICEDCVSKGLTCAIRHSCYRNSKLQTAACVISTKIHRMTGIFGKINYICLTNFNKEKLLLLKQIKSKQVFIKPNFVESKCEIIPYGKRKNQFAFIGRLDEVKGIDLLLSSWKKMGNDAPNLLICGIGPMEEWCKNYIKENNLSSVKMVGFVSNEEAIKIVASSKALILPTQWYEGFPMTIVEAYSVGTPVLGSNIGNVGSFIEDGKNGFKFKNNIDSIIDSINSIEKVDLTDKLSDIYSENFSIEQNYKMLSKIYNEVTNK